METAIDRCDAYRLAHCCLKCTLRYRREVRNGEKNESPGNSEEGRVQEGQKHRNVESLWGRSARSEKVLNVDGTSSLTSFLFLWFTLQRMNIRRMS